MFKYISDILKQFNSTQKLFALFILLVSIVSISYITMITKTPEELSNTIKMQRDGILKSQQHISNLSLKINSLNDSMFVINQRCNDEAIEREKYYTKKLIEQQIYVTKTIDEIKKLLNQQYINKKISEFELDTLNNQPDNLNNVTIIEKLNKIKNKIKN